MLKLGRRPFPGGFCRLLLVLTGIVWGITMEVGRGVGQYVYRWTDAQGGVHFTQSPPPPDTQFEVRNMPGSPSTPAPPANETAAEPEATPAGTPATKHEGTARVELGKQSTQEVGPSTRLFEGTVQNVGGTEARNVVVRVTVTETQQGDECLQAEIDISPSSLPPGASGTFEAKFDNPCFFGNVSIRMEPDWD
jgi:hypothetical protein